MFRKKTLGTIILTIASFAICMAIAAGHEYKEKVIGILGGTISLSEGTKIVVLPGALLKNTLLSIERWTDEDKVYFHFGPDGLQFNLPVIICLSWASLEDVDLEDLILYYWDEEKGEWVEVCIAEWDLVEKACKFYINHFSYYYYQRR
ncbi:hypothetical protein FJZ31_42610 [Candidatus Poribacteria bacterium]|nr:hypothetical protein [Candidatus Poribacteria bacterium]